MMYLHILITMYIKNYAKVTSTVTNVLLNPRITLAVAIYVFSRRETNFFVMVKRPLILVTNDDGITAPGIRVLIEVMNTLGDVVVVAPDKPQSGMGHAITINDTLYCDDCVKLATQQILDRKPDLCVSGINHGSNSSINVIYSGTMSAALEAGVEGIPAIGFSLLDYSNSASFEHCKSHIQSIARQVLEKGLPTGVILNVNFPKVTNIPLKGIKICRQANARWVEDFDKRTNPMGREYYWLSGEFVNHDTSTDTDEWALENNINRHHSSHYSKHFRGYSLHPYFF